MKNDGVNAFDYLGNKTLSDGSAVWDPTPSGWTPGHPRPSSVGHVGATLTYPDDKCEGTAILRLKIDPVGNKTTENYFNAGSIEAKHVPIQVAMIPGSHMGRRTIEVIIRLIPTFHLRAQNPFLRIALVALLSFA